MQTKRRLSNKDRRGKVDSAEEIESMVRFAVSTQPAMWIPLMMMVSACCVARSRSAVQIEIQPLFQRQPPSKNDRKLRLARSLS